MLQVTPIDLEPPIVKFMHHFMSERILHMRLVEQMIGTNENTELRMKTSCLLIVARRAQDLDGLRIWREQGEVLLHEAYDRAYEPASMRMTDRQSTARAD